MRTVLDEKALRSRTMGAVKSQNTRPEMIVRRLIHALGYRYRLHASNLPGKPDIVFRPRRKVIFVHGCFWHGHDCPRGSRKPKQNSAYWSAKIARNRSRDAGTDAAFMQMGWKTLTMWECELKDAETLSHRVRSFLDDADAAIYEAENERAECNAVIRKRREANIADDGEERLHHEQCGDERGDEADGDHARVVEA